MKTTTPARLVLFSIAAFCLGLTGGPGTATAAIVDPKIESLCTELQKRGQLNGVVLVAEGDTLIHHQAYGLASAELALPHTVDSRFMIASATKAITASAILRAVEQGRLDLKKPISAYLEELADTPVGALTAHELLSHSGGLPAFVKIRWALTPRSSSWRN